MKSIKKIICTLLILIGTNVYAGNAEMEYACSSIPGMYECKRMNSSSFWVIMSNSSIIHNYQEYGSMLCNGGGFESTFLTSQI